MNFKKLTGDFVHIPKKSLRSESKLQLKQLKIGVAIFNWLPFLKYMHKPFSRFPLFYVVFFIVFVDRCQAEIRAVVFKIRNKVQIATSRPTIGVTPRILIQWLLFDSVS